MRVAGCTDAWGCSCTEPYAWTGMLASVDVVFRRIKARLLGLASSSLVLISLLQLS